MKKGDKFVSKIGPVYFIFEIIEILKERMYTIKIVGETVDKEVVDRYLEER